MGMSAASPDTILGLELLRPPVASIEASEEIDGELSSESRNYSYT
jgi:hypothetical protein